MKSPSMADHFSLPLSGPFLEGLGLEIPPSVAGLVQESLFDPLSDFLSKPGKKFRARLVETGYRLAIPERKRDLTRTQKRRCLMIAGIVETLHAGALIIDDIQDGSTIRRDAPAFHLRHGVGKSINAANWLYFWPLTQLQEMRLSRERELLMYRDCLNVLNLAHIGQAIDISTPIDGIPQSEVEDICLTSIRLKTGVLMSLAMSLGALAAGSTPAISQELARLGCELGLALQKFDDAGTFSLERSHLSKRYEDLLLKRPSWVWALAAKRYSARDYQDFVRAARYLPDESYLSAWLGLHDFANVLRLASVRDLDSTMSEIMSRFGNSHPETTQELWELGEALKRSYG